MDLMDAKADISDNSDGWDEDFTMGDPLFQDLSSSSGPQDQKEIIDEAARSRVPESILGQNEGASSVLHLGESRPKASDSSVPDILDLPATQTDIVSQNDRLQESALHVNEDSRQQKLADESAFSSPHVSVSTETKGLISTITRSSSTDENYFGPPDVPPPAMITSISTVSDGSEEERFVKVKPGDFEFESSKGSSQSGKDNLESEEQITVLTNRCESLRSELSEKENQYLQVKLQLESILLEKNVESDALTKASQQLGRLKDELLTKDRELTSARDIFDEFSVLLEMLGFNVTEEDRKKLPEILRSLMETLASIPHRLRRAPLSDLESTSKPDILSETNQSSSLTAGGDFQVHPSSRSYATAQSSSEISRSSESISLSRTQDGAEVKNLRAMLDEKSMEIDSLNSKCNALEASLSFTQNELAELRYLKLDQRSEIVHGSPTSNFSTVELDNERQDCPALSLNNVEQLLGEKAIYAQPLLKHCQDLEVRLQTLVTELNDIKERESDVIGGYQSVCASLEKLQLDYAERQKELSEKDCQLDNLRDYNKLQNDNEIARFKEELISKDEDLMELEANLVELRDSSEQKEKLLSCKISDLEIELEELKQNMELSQKSLDDAHSTQSDKVLTELKDSLSNKEAELCSTQESLKSTVNELELTKVELKEFKVKHEKLEEKFKKAINTIKQRNAKLAEAKENESRASPDSANDKTLSEMQSVIASLETKLEEKEIEIRRLQQSLTETVEKARKLEVNFDVEMRGIKKEQSSHEEQLQQLLGNMADKSAAVEQLLRHTEELQALIARQNEELSSAITLKDEEIRRAIQQYDEYYQQSQEQINQLTYNLQSKLDEMTSLKEEFTELERDLTTNQRQLVELKQLFQNSEQSNHQLRSRLQECQSELDEKKLELQHYVNEREAANAKVGDLLLDIKTKTANLSRLEEALAVKTETINLLEFNVNECKATIADNNQQIAELQSKLQTLLQELDESERREKEAQAYKESYKQLVQLKSDNNILQLQVADLQNRHTQTVREFERKSAEMEQLKDAEVLGSRNELNRVTEERDNLMKQLQESHELKAELERYRTSMLTANEVAHSTIQEASAKIESLREEIQLKDKMIDCLEKERSRLLEIQAALQNACLETRKKTEEMVDEFTKKQAESKLQQEQNQESGADGTNRQASQQPRLSVNSSDTDELQKLLHEEKGKREALERKVELLQAKIHEIEVSEMKAFEESLMLKTWMREVELENIKYAEELRGYQASSGWDGENPKVKTLQNEVLRLVQSLEDRDKRSTHLTMEITRLLEERDGLQLKLSSTLRQNIALSEKFDASHPSTDSDDGFLQEKEQLEKKLAQLEEINYSLDVDLKRAKEARRLVQEQLLLSQTSKFYRNHASPRLGPSQAQVPYSLPAVSAPVIPSFPDSASALTENLAHLPATILGSPQKNEANQ